MTANTDPDRVARLRREAVRCTTHHEACACRELAHAEAEAEVERLNAEARRMTALHADTVEELDTTREALAGAQNMLAIILQTFPDVRGVCEELIADMGSAQDEGEGSTKG